MAGASAVLHFFSKSRWLCSMTPRIREMGTQLVSDAPFPDPFFLFVKARIAELGKKQKKP
jgi:hypothetical protein